MDPIRGPWVSLLEAVRRAVLHRRDWPLPISIVARPPAPAGRWLGPGLFSAVPASSCGPGPPAVFRLGEAELSALALAVHDPHELDRQLNLIARAQAGAVPDIADSRAPRPGASSPPSFHCQQPTPGFQGPRREDK